VNGRPLPTDLVQGSIRLERRQWDRVSGLAQRAGLTVAATIRRIVDLGANELERQLSNDGGDS
jgi:predicted DNA-binding ribbon-helix-helix protein